MFIRRQVRLRMREESAWLEDSVRVCDQEEDRQKEKDTERERKRDGISS